MNEWFPGKVLKQVVRWPELYPTPHFQIFKSPNYRITTFSHYRIIKSPFLHFATRFCPFRPKCVEAVSKVLSVMFRSYMLAGIFIAKLFTYQYFNFSRFLSCER
jgi:hypothetical protein